MACDCSQSQCFIEVPGYQLTVSLSAQNKMPGKSDGSRQTLLPRSPADNRFDDQYKRARSHSAMVGFLKLILPVLAFCLIAWIVIVSLFGAIGTGELSVESSGISNGKLVMEAPKLKGYSNDNLPYDLSASRAVQDLKKPGLIALENIQASIPMEAGIFADIGALTGVYDTDKEWLSLEKKIVVSRQDGSVIRLSTAEIDLSNGRLTSLNPVSVTTLNSNISADQVEVLENGSIIVFKQRVRMILNPATKTD